ncbi:tRNA (N6-threonylcarbamoyladenosine(37)-N6)-methyltransferase TrmO [Thalassotalea litorea]|uniref:tRNA (N6-threonylcarbamoyladenosine(37)-N6)-methyltransferase TrmO n=1 Tax=Thalassotalea litorea TaxID=2020715 RepID=A0A5R9II42_9GAMM|nr:tRNA (N6-threonylcarbamoyladenosine(37)-N6)-methyltransferase TrmO [Thalassotalea litorea]TLU64123.1 tRNA (N6-threonylcarbamoyladenosine(37)-N6)-methyltransferase TrmO [Thalassotalea litorea]
MSPIVSVLWQSLSIDIGNHEEIVPVQEYTFTPIAIAHTPYREKFAIPRQPGLVSAAKGTIELLPPFNDMQMLRDIEQHSHLWVLFVFHGTADRGWKPLIKAPRLGGNQKTGVLASRSTFRPNPIGMSVVKLDGINLDGENPCLEISGMDLMDGTPVIDIKPYIPYSDALNDARSEFAPAPEQHDITVIFLDQVEQQLAKLVNGSELKELIYQVLLQDPRPAYKKKDLNSQEYGMALDNFNVRWQISGKNCVVIHIESIT